MKKHQGKGPFRKPPAKKNLHASPFLTAVVANAAGEIFDLDGYAAVGRDGPLLAPLTSAATVPLPHGSELMRLPDRMPILYDMARGCMVTLPEDPYAPGQAIFPVAAFNSPGYLLTAVSAYEENSGAGHLPLFSYGALGWHRGKFRSAVIQVDAEPRQDLRQMPLEKIQAGVRRLRKELPDNRLRAHLEKCALTYGCPAGKNFFLARYEAPLPTSPSCNARCLGCISLQAEGDIPCSQERIAFTPSPREIAAVALAHIRRVKQAVVSFGQGCEGDPLLAADTISAAIELIRAETDQGTIHMNTNGSLPQKIDQVIAAGLDSLRISLNSVRQPCYDAYFRPKGYSFDQVLAAIDTAASRGVFVAINYLNCPGFTDTPQESRALLSFLKDHAVRMIQWRNLNFDPLRYLAAMNRAAAHDAPIGVEPLLAKVRQTFPALRHGYFNPPKESFSRQG
ncbi:MAG: radical SAM protein [Desulfobacteraceae bacterium]|nr:radical SAM protein [Desulfobacteraceae bacterium]